MGMYRQGKKDAFETQPEPERKNWTDAEGGMWESVADGMEHRLYYHGNFQKKWEYRKENYLRGVWPVYVGKTFRYVKYDPNEHESRAKHLQCYALGGFHTYKQEDLPYLVEVKHEMESGLDKKEWMRLLNEKLESIVQHKHKRAQPIGISINDKTPISGSLAEALNGDFKSVLREKTPRT